LILKNDNKNTNISILNKDSLYNKEKNRNTMGGGQSCPLGPNGINSAYSSWLILPNSLQKISKLPQPKLPLPPQTKKSPIRFDKNNEGWRGQFNVCVSKVDWRR
jgi:hypothetical protein